jgi:hypothetical protein
MVVTCVGAQCAVPVWLFTLSGMGVQHLLVCTNTSNQCLVTIVAVQSCAPRQVASFRIRSRAMCVERVPGFGRVQIPEAFTEDTVWIATSQSLYVCYINGSLIYITSIALDEDMTEQDNMQCCMIVLTEVMCIVIEFS